MIINSKFLKRILMLIVALSMFSSTCFAAWWATPGYEWALSKGLTPIKSQASLNQSVSHADLYSTIIKYLNMKGVNPYGRKIHHYDDMYGLNNVIVGVFGLINEYTSKSSLTPDEYRIVASYIDHGRETFEKYKGLMRRYNQNVDLYLRLSKYKAATLINDREYRAYVLANLGNIRNVEILNYGIIPYVGNITRMEFLLLMHSLLSEQYIADEEVLKRFNDTGVLLGYQNDLMLEKDLTYAEMLTFLYRFEIYDFNPSSDGAGEEE